MASYVANEWNAPGIIVRVECSPVAPTQCRQQVNVIIRRDEYHARISRIGGHTGVPQWVEYEWVNAGIRAINNVPFVVTPSLEVRSRSFRRCQYATAMNGGRRSAEQGSARGITGVGVDRWLRPPSPKNHVTVGGQVNARQNGRCHLPIHRGINRCGGGTNVVPEWNAE